MPSENGTSLSAAELVAEKAFDKIQSEKNSGSLSGIAVILLIATGLLVFVFVFIFAKRQIMRYASSARKDPHAPIGSGLSDGFFSRRERVLKRRLRENLTRIASIDVMPVLSRNLCLSAESKAYFYRMRTLDDLRLLEQELDHANYTVRRRRGQTLLRFFKELEACCQPRGVVMFDEGVLKRVCELLERAEFSSSAFGESEYRAFSQELSILIASVKRQRSAISHAVVVRDAKEALEDVIEREERSCFGALRARKRRESLLEEENELLMLRSGKKSVGRMQETIVGWGPARKKHERESLL